MLLDATAEEVSRLCARIESLAGSAEFEIEIADYSSMRVQFALPKSTVVFCTVGSLLLLCMGLFHASGLMWITGEIADSNAKPFLVAVFPVLFLHVSIQLIGLAAFGVSLLFVRTDIRLIAAFITVMVLADVALAIWLRAYIPGVALSLAAMCFALVAVKSSDTT